MKISGLLLVLIGLATASWAIFGYSIAYPDPYATAGAAGRDMEIMLNNPSPQQVDDVRRNQAIHAGDIILSPERIARRSQLTQLGFAAAIIGAILAAAGAIAGRAGNGPTSTTAPKRDLAVKLGLFVPPVIILAIVVAWVAF